MSTTPKKFDIALSFPGKYRTFVGDVAARLADQVGRERILYDKFHEAEFARPDLDTYLQHLYHDESELVVAFLCADYKDKEWCGLEWRAIRDLIKQRKISSVMLLRFDSTEIPGLFSTDGYIFIDNHRTIKEVADLIYQRLQVNKGLSNISPNPVVFNNISSSDSPQSTRIIPPSAVLAIWQEKLNFLLFEEAQTVDADQKFRLYKLIEEAKGKIRENGGQT
jgi:hypothetical protein